MVRIPDQEALGDHRFQDTRQMERYDGAAMAAPGKAVAGLGHAIASMGNSLGGFLDASTKEDDAKQKYETATRFLDLDLQANDYLKERQRDIHPQGDGFREDITQNWDAKAREFFKSVPDKLKPEFDYKLRQRGVDYERKAREIENKQNDTFHINDVGQRLDSYRALIDAEPDNVREHIGRGLSLIEDSRLPTNAKEKLKSEFARTGEKRAIEQRLQRGDDPEQVLKDIQTRPTNRRGPDGQPLGDPSDETGATGAGGSPSGDAKTYLRSRLAPGYEKRTSDVDNLNPVMVDRLAALTAAAQEAGHDIRIVSGHRDAARQAVLWENALQKYGSAEEARKYVAPPGGSSHQSGEAVDLQYGDRGAGLGGKRTAAVEWAHANAAKFGLTFPLGHEDWHIEPVEARQGGKRYGGVYDTSKTYWKGGSGPAGDSAGAIKTTLSAYSPQAGGSKMEGGYAASKPGPDGKAEVRTLEDVANGESDYVTVAGNPSLAGKTYTIPEISFIGPDGKTQTLKNVKAVVHDTGSAFKNAPEGRFDVPISKDADDALMAKNAGMWKQAGVQFIPGGSGKAAPAQSPPVSERGLTRYAALGNPVTATDAATGGKPPVTGDATAAPERTKLTLTGTAEEKAAKLRELYGQGYNAIIHQLDKDGNDVVIASKKDKPSWYTNVRGDETYDDANGNKVTKTRNQLEFTGQRPGPAWASGVIEDFKAGKIEVSGKPGLPAADDAAVARTTAQGQVATILDGIPDDRPMSELPDDIRAKVMGMLPKDALQPKTMPDGSKVAAIDTVSVGEVKAAFAAPMQQARSAGVAEPGVQVAEADTSGGMKTGPVYSDNAPYRWMNEADRKLMASKAIVAQRNKYLTSGDGEARYIAKNGEESRDENGRTLLERAQSVLLPNQMTKLRNKINVAKWNYQMTAPIPDMPDAQLDAHLEKMAPTDADASDLENYKAKSEAFAAATKLVAKVRHLRETDGALAAEASPEVREAHKAIKQSMAQSAELAKKAPPGMDVTSTVMSVPEANERLIEARLEAQSRIYGDKRDFRVRSITLQEAKALLQTKSSSGMSADELSLDLKEGAERADRWYGKYADRAYKDAVKMLIHSKDGQEEATGIMADMMKKIASGEQPSKSDMFKYQMIQKMDPVQMFMAGSGGMKPRGDGMPRQVPVTFGDQQGTMRDGNRPQQGQMMPAPGNEPALAPAARGSGGPSAGDVRGSKQVTVNQPTPAQIEWVLKDPQNRAPVFDRMFGENATKGQMEWKNKQGNGGGLLGKMFGFGG